MMTSVVDKYYRQIIQNIDNIRMKFDISSLLVKSKEHDSKIDTNESNISGNKSLIDTNESNISDNKSLIDTNTNNITNNLSKINDNTNNINNNLSKINTNNNNFTSVLNKSNNNVSSISSNLNKINTNLSKITNNTNKINNNTSLINTYIKGLNLINTNTSNNSSDISNNLSLIDTNKNNITNNYNLTQINKKKSEFNTSLIDNNRNNISSILPLKSNYTIDNIWLFNLNSNKDINFLSNIKKILVYETNIDYQFKVNSFIEINESILYKYENIKSFYFVLKETYILMDQNDTILDKFSFNIKSKGAVFRNYHIYNNQYFFKVQNDIKILKIKVYLERLNDDNNMEFNLQLNSDYQNNYITLKYFKYTS